MRGERADGSRWRKGGKGDARPGFEPPMQVGKQPSRINCQTDASRCADPNPITHPDSVHGTPPARASHSGQAGAALCAAPSAVNRPLGYTPRHRRRRALQVEGGPRADPPSPPRRFAARQSVRTSQPQQSGQMKAQNRPASRDWPAGRQRLCPPWRRHIAARPKNKDCPNKAGPPEPAFIDAISTLFACFCCRWRFWGIGGIGRSVLNPSSAKLVGFPRFVLNAHDNGEPDPTMNSVLMTSAALRHTSHCQSVNLVTRTERHSPAFESPQAQSSRPQFFTDQIRPVGDCADLCALDAMKGLVLDSETSAKINSMSTFQRSHVGVRRYTAGMSSDMIPTDILAELPTRGVTSVRETSLCWSSSPATRQVINLSLQHELACYNACGEHFINLVFTIPRASVWGSRRAASAEVYDGTT
ncbi:uncharacterized protein C8Q71DRAFT_849307, partial [Rhodofomes roseus]